MKDSLGVAVIGAGMAGRAHAAAYRTAPSLYEPKLPPIRLVSIADVNAGFGEADDIDLVSVVIANSLYR